MEDKWIKVLSDGRHVKFTYQDLAEDRSFITAQGCSYPPIRVSSFA